jgi:hypothetical protein
MEEKLSNRARITLAAVALQWIVGILLFVLPFGFDHPSSLGLDWDDLMFGLKVFCGLTVLALSLAIWSREWIAIVPAGLPVVAAALFCLYLKLN